MSVHRFKYLFHQFVNRTATTEEAEEFLSMMKEDGYDDEAKILLDEFWNESTSLTPLDEAKKERIFNQLMASYEPVRTFNRKKMWLKIAAVLILTSSALFYTMKVRTSDTQLVNVNATKVVKPDKSGRRFINLPDGSSVILNENSYLNFGNKFNTGGKREVYLEGEAYFDIKHDALHPFIVHTGKLQTTVLGTAFNIDEDSEDRTITVTVTRGKVKVGDESHIFNVINPNEQVVFDMDLSRHIKKVVKAETFTAWKNDDIYFDDVYMKDVVHQLEEHFGVSINFSNEAIKNCRFSATFLKSQSLEQILNVIGEFNHIKYEFKDNHTILLDGAGCE